jgi:hypothetical protein
MWIDIDNYDLHLEIGTIGYLVETLNTSSGRTTYALRERPLRTNQSHEPRLSGWCGETDNRSRYARGVWRVTKVNRAGDRASISRVTGADLARFLEEDGHPDLIPPSARAATAA